MRSALFATLALAFPHQLKSATHPSSAHVATTIDSFEAVQPARAYDGMIQDAADTYNVDPKLIRSVMRAESAFDPWAVSRAGAQGLMQLMPNISLAFGVTDPFDPRQNIMAGTRLLRELLDLHRGNLPLVLASYNAGAGIVSQYGGEIPPFEETENYVKRVTQYINND
ncbi:MAG TPA: lytic transglycosylase domain-containing protein [Vicinamibacterales bacterium]|nr:lytic transglycosylase domain-containing protein [Vicinamibacterales bacterium]